jgi:hypothetical protein
VAAVPSKQASQRPAADGGEYWADLRSRYRTAGVLASLRRVRWRGPMAIPLIAASFGLLMVATFSVVGLPSAQGLSAVPASLPRPQSTGSPSPSRTPSTSPSSAPASSESELAIGESEAPSVTSPKVSESPSPEPSEKKIDQCVVGTWKATAEEWYLDMKPGVQHFTGKGTVVRFRADGTGVFEVGAGTPQTATAGTKTWTLVYTGTIPFRSFRTGGDELSYSEQSPSGTTAQKVNGVVTKTGPLAAWSGFLHYTCSGSSMRLFVGSKGSVGNHVLELRRS